MTGLKRKYLKVLKDLFNMELMKRNREVDE